MMSDFSVQFYNERIKRGLSIQQASEVFNITYNTIVNWEKGTVLPHLNTYHRVCHMWFKDHMPLTTRHTGGELESFPLVPKGRIEVLFPNEDKKEQQKEEPKEKTEVCVFKTEPKPEEQKPEEPKAAQTVSMNSFVEVMDNMIPYVENGMVTAEFFVAWYKDNRKKVFA